MTERMASEIKDNHERCGDQCAICISQLAAPDFDEGGIMTASSCPCGHVFHTKCIEAWMRKKRECPTCKASVPHREVRRLFVTFGGGLGTLEVREKDNENDSLADSLARSQAALNTLRIRFEVKPSIFSLSVGCDRDVLKIIAESRETEICY